MYLKSIEIQGFKSFANKIVFDFHNGITGIVGPNGSGKSNVADAVRWVLGEQSAKQLRGAKMEDVIFAGTQARKPVGFAYVAITLDNSDHALAVDYNEVTVSRRVYRSGESEYKINGHTCRLKDISELFYDTGIGKEGYSIIGQGQIDKILSGKPEERRELFDEAAGIVKFKRRKTTALKKLENERNNLVRVNDILSELEKQVGPLEKQSQKAKEYLQLKEKLKIYDVNGFLLETDKVKEDIKVIEEKIAIAKSDLEDARNEYENTKSEYQAAEEQLQNINSRIDEITSVLSREEMKKQKLEGDINLFSEQIKTIESNNVHYGLRIEAINKELDDKKLNILNLEKEKENLSGNLNEYKQKQDDAQKAYESIVDSINNLSDEINNNKDIIFKILNQKSNIKEDNQRLKTLLEQLNIKKAELSSNIIKGKSEEKAQHLIIEDFNVKLTDNNKVIEGLTDNINSVNNELALKRTQITDLTSKIDKAQQNYHREKSKLESLVNITERYDGYGNSIKKIMELKSDNKGILGVIADIVKVEKKYEIAIETALGGTIQNIVTDNEKTAKDLIGYLKNNKFGRATFLPMSSIQVRNTLENDACINESGVVGVASDLVKVSFEYEKLAKYLLGRILVVDNIDNALAIARKYKYSIRIVTLEGEQLNPGGSMTGGAFKNSSNLLGRRREIEELKKSVSDNSKLIGDSKQELSQIRKEVSSLKEKLDENNKLMRDAQIEKNTLELNLKQAISKKNEIINSYSDFKTKLGDVDEEIQEISKKIENVSDDLASLDNKNELSQQEIEELSRQLEQMKQKENEHSAEIENIKIKYSSVLQKSTFADENIVRIREEIEKLGFESKDLLSKISDTDEGILGKQNEIKEAKDNIAATDSEIIKLNESISELKSERDNVNASHKVFFEKREKLNEQIAELDKECFRLDSKYEKYQESIDNLTDYMWNEYELTYGRALELKNPEINNLSEIKKNIFGLKSDIKKLGDVNVNSIEEYKEVNERYTFLKGQHDDLINAENSLIQVIEELDSGMRKQFEIKFKEIKTEFDKVFKELFGGGRGTIELVDNEDVLEAGIVIISQPPGKKLQNMMQLSGGEKALTAIALLFAIQNLKPSPFCLLDEIEAALDDSNVGRYANYLHKLTANTQFIVITHRRGTMNAADRLYGITMQEKGVSTLVSVDLIANDLEKDRKRA